MEPEGSAALRGTISASSSDLPPLSLAREGGRGGESLPGKKGLGDESLPEEAPGYEASEENLEDDTIVAAVIRGLLEREGHQVVHVTNGLAALAELAQTSFEAVLLDLDLPGVDGFQIARLIRQREQAGVHLPIIAVTARTGSEDELRARAAGMDGFLHKPLSGEQLAAALVQNVTGVAARASDHA